MTKFKKQDEFQPNLAQNIPGCRGLKFVSNEGPEEPYSFQKISLFKKNERNGIDYTSTNTYSSLIIIKGYSVPGHSAIILVEAGPVPV